MELLLGGVAAVGAGVFTNPLEVVKIRMQLQGELKSKGTFAVHYRNVFHAAYAISKNDGILALQKGLAPALFYQLIMNGTRLGLYDLIDGIKFTRHKDGTVSPLRSMTVGLFSGLIGASIGSPLYLIKTHLQSQANEAIAVGHQHQHTGMIRAFQSIYKQHGVTGLFRGITSTLPRVGIASAVQLSTFEKSIEFVRNTKYITTQDRWTTAFLASLLSGLLVSVAMAPFDLVSTRFYNQGVNEKGKGLMYRSVIDCGLKIHKAEGFAGFYKGWTALWFRLGPHTLLTLMFWDQLKHHHKKYKKET